MVRIASCSCGQLKLTIQGDPTDVTVCHCFECQKSTGSVFGVSTYWPKTACRSIEGEAKLWRRSSDAGRWLDNYFCAVCGSTVYWYAEFAPDEIGVAAGNFADPSFPAPTWRALALSKTPLAPPDFTQQIFRDPYHQVRCDKAKHKSTA